MKQFFQNTVTRWFCFLFMLFLLGAFLSFLLRSQSSPVISVLSFLTRPLQNIGAQVAEQTKDIALSFRSSREIQARYQEKLSEIEALRVKLVDYEETKNKLKLYQEFLELKTEHPEDQFAEAEVVSQEETHWSFVLNQGSLAGIKVQDPVIYGKNLVGIVESVTPVTAKVRTILHPQSYVAVYDPASGEIGSVTTTIELSQQGLCVIPQLERGTEILRDANICTSGQGGIVPRGLIIGTVAEVQDDTENNVSALALIEPAIEFSQLKDVFILIKK